MTTSPQTEKHNTWFSSLRWRLVLIFIASAVTPLVLSGSIIGWLGYTNQQQDSLRLQRQIAETIGSKVSAFMHQRENELVLLHEVSAIETLDPETQRDVLSNMLLHDQAYQELALLDATGQEQFRLSLSGVFVGDELRSRAGDEEFTFPMTSRETYYGPVYFDDTIREPLMTISVPLLDLRKGEVVCVLVAELRFKVIWDLLSELNLPSSESVYILDQTGKVIAHPNPSIVLSGTTIASPIEDGRTEGLSGQDVFLSRNILQFGDQVLAVVAERSAAEAMEVSTSSTGVTVGVIMITLVIVIFLVVGLTGQIIKPIQALAAAAQQVSQGYFRQRVQVSSRDEIYAMAEAFNRMSDQLEQMLADLNTEIESRKQAEQEVRDLNKELEERVTQRTAQLEAINQELGDFAYVVSHDLKAPLRAIRQLSDWLGTDYADAFDGRGQEMLDLLKQRSMRMHNLIDGILNYSRIGRTSEHPLPVDLNQLVDKVVDGLSPPEHIQVRVTCELPTLVREFTHLERIFQNLIDNAIRFMDKPAGEVTIGCSDEGEYWLFRVADNGPGIEEKYHEKVFQVFQTLAPRDEFESTGIGLALVKKIVERWGGRIWIESCNGEGCAVYFTINKGGVDEGEHAHSTG